MPLVHNTVTHPVDGSPAALIPVTVSLIAATLGAAPGYEVGRTVQGYSKVVTATDGQWTADLVTNDDLSPASTYYEVEERTPAQPPIRHAIAVPEAPTTALTGEHVLPQATITLASASEFDAATPAAPRWANVGGQLVRYTGKTSTTLTGTTGGTGTVADGATVDQAYWVGDILTDLPITIPTPALTFHIADPLDAHDASAISVVPAGGLGSTSVQAALAELDGELSAEAALRYLGDATRIANSQTVDYTLVLTDAGKAVEINSATGKNVTVPPNASVAFPLGTLVEVVQVGAGVATLAAGIGVAISGDIVTPGRGGSLLLRNVGTNLWRSAIVAVRSGTYAEPVIDSLIFGG